MITFSSKERSKQEEVMDGFQLQGEGMEDLLTDLKCVNKLLGGNAITTEGIAKLITDKTKEYTLLDVGCGDGEILRQCANYGRKRGLKFKLIGLDGNPHILAEAQKRSVQYPEISYVTFNILGDTEKLPEIDIALFTLFLHHFENEKIEQILSNLMSKCTLGLVVNDLQRSPIAFNLFKVFSSIFIKTKIAKHDGLVSVARSFRKSELEIMSKRLHFSKQTIKWKWAFRYQWVLWK